MSGRRLLLAVGMLVLAVGLGAGAIVVLRPDRGTSAARSAATALLLRDVVKPESIPATSRVVAFQMDAPLPAGTRVAAYLPAEIAPGTDPATCSGGERKLDQDAWLFWVDDMPSALFSHPNRFVLISAHGDALLSVTDEWWPPCIDGAVYAPWLDDDERAHSGRRAFATPNAEVMRPSSIPGSVRGPAAVSARGGAMGSPSVMQADSPRAGVVAINGDALLEVKGSTAFKNDIERTQALGRQRGLPTSGGTVAGADPIVGVRAHIDDVVSGGRANRVLLVIDGHGGVDSAGESFVVLSGKRLTRSQLDNVLGSYPDVTFAVAVAACRSSDFGTMRSKNIERVETCASSPHDYCYFDTGIRSVQQRLSDAWDRLRGESPAEGNQAGSRWLKGVLTALEGDTTFPRALGDSLAAAGRAGASVADATQFAPLFRDPDTGRYLTRGATPGPSQLPGGGSTPGTGGSGNTGPQPVPTGGATAPGAPILPRTGATSGGAAAPTATRTAAPAGTSAPLAPTSAPSEPSGPRVFRGTFAGSGSFRNDICTWRTTYQGSVTLTLTFSGSGVSGTARHIGRYDDVLTNGPSECGGDSETFDETLPVSGSASALRWSFGHGEGGSVSVTASLVGNAIVGQGVVRDPAYQGSATIPFTAN